MNKNIHNVCFCGCPDFSCCDVCVAQSLYTGMRFDNNLVLTSAVRGLQKHWTSTPICPISRSTVLIFCIFVQAERKKKNSGFKIIVLEVSKNIAINARAYPPYFTTMLLQQDSRCHNDMQC